MNINDEVVEAAAKASFEFMEDMEWGLATFLDKELFKDAARRTLEAAGPVLMAQAWEEGEHAGYLNRGAEEFGLSRPNPYRDAGVGE